MERSLTFKGTDSVGRRVASQLQPLCSGTVLNEAGQESRKDATCLKGGEKGLTAQSFRQGGLKGQILAGQLYNRFDFSDRLHRGGFNRKRFDPKTTKMIQILGGLIVLVLGVLGYVFFASKSKQSSTPSRPTGNRPTPMAKPAAKANYDVDDEDEATQVRVIGPRIVRIMGGLKVGDEIPIGTGLTVGRGGNCTLRLQDGELSNVHAEFRIEAGVPVITDLGSTNGSFLNDQKLTANLPAPIKDGDRIKLGTSNFLFNDSK